MLTWQTIYRGERRKKRRNDVYERIETEETSPDRDGRAGSFLPGVSRSGEAKSFSQRPQTSSAAARHHRLLACRFQARSGPGASADSPSFAEVTPARRARSGALHGVLACGPAPRARLRDLLAVPASQRRSMTPANHVEAAAAARYNRTMAEIFPARLRSTCYGISVVSGISLGCRRSRSRTRHRPRSRGRRWEVCGRRRTCSRGPRVNPGLARAAAAGSLRGRRARAWQWWRRW